MGKPHIALSREGEILFEHFMSCKGINHLDRTNATSKELHAAFRALYLKKLCPIDLRKLFGYCSTGKRHSLGKFPEVALLSSVGP